MTTTSAPRHRSTPARLLDVEVVLPAHDDERTLGASVRRLHGYLGDNAPFSWQITVADVGSTDGTWAVARGLVDQLDRVSAVHLDATGRGQALRAVWATSTARVAASMDVDLSTGLDAFLPLVAPVLSGHSDLAVGSRLARGARVVRGAGRHAASRRSNLVRRAALRSRPSDARCGPKAIRADVARRLLPLVEGDGWFFDTELLVLAEHNGLRIHEVPVDWVGGPGSRADTTRSVAGELRQVARVMGGLGRLHLRRRTSAPTGGLSGRPGGR